MMWNLSRRAFVGLALGAGALAVSGLAGCKHNDSDADAEPEMSPNKTQALMDADKMISDAEEAEHKAMAMPADAPDRDKIIKEAEQKKAEGEKAKERAMMMK